MRYSEYEYKKAGDSQFYITPVAGAKLEVYDPLKDAAQMVLDALNVGALQMNRKSGNEVRDAVMEFVGRYELLGFLTALCPLRRPSWTMRRFICQRIILSGKNLWLLRTI